MLEYSIYYIANTNINMVQGFAELEYGMLRYMGAIDDSTPVITSGQVLLSYTTCFMSKL